jgi:hypothetical protein
MRAIITTVLLCLFIIPAHANQNNNIMKACIDSTEDFTKAAACYQDWKQGQNTAELAELRDFLKHNPRYRFPGQSLNRCWGKPREMPFESSYIRVGPDGMEAGVNYKDTLPAGCYENAPWDNRNEQD